MSIIQTRLFFIIAVYVFYPFNWAAVKIKLLLQKLKFLVPLLLLPLFFILHGYNQYFGLIAFPIVLKLFFKYFLIVLVVSLVSLLIFKGERNSFLFSLFLLFLFFFFGSIHDELHTLFGNGSITSYRFLLPALVLIIFALALWLRKNGRLEKWVAYSKMLLLILTVMETLIFGFDFFTDKNKENYLAKPVQPGGPVNEAPARLLDIFFIVFDEYASSRSLAEDMGFDNHEMDSLLEASHFFISRNSKSNYNFTFTSLASTFNLNYLDLNGRRALDEKLTLQSIYTIKHNAFIDFLAKNNYEIKNYGCFNFEHFGAKAIPYFDDNYIASFIDGQTLASRVLRDIGWNFTTKNIVTGQFRIPDAYKKAKRYHLYRNQFNFQGLISELNSPHDKPRFVYVHLMLPHEPFYLKQDGQMVSDTSIIMNNFDAKQLYLDQVGYSNLLIKKIINAVQNSPDENLALVMEGDHGYKYFDEKDSAAKFRNLNAFYFSDKNYSALYNGISPVNTFRVICNKYLNQALPLLNDSCIYLKDRLKK